MLLPGRPYSGAVLAPISGKLFDTYGARPGVVGSMLVVVSLLLVGIVALTTLLFMVFYMLYALGQGLSMGNTMTNGLEQLPPELQADGNAVINTFAATCRSSQDSYCSGNIGGCSCNVSAPTTAESTLRVVSTLSLCSLYLE